MAGEGSDRDVQALADFSDNDLIEVTDPNVTTGKFAGAGGKSVTNTRGDLRDWLASELGGVDTTGTIEANDFARFTDADTLAGRSPAEVRADLDLEVGTDLASAAQGALADTAVQPADLATVATTGDYDDLTGAPAHTHFADMTFPEGIVETESVSEWFAPANGTLVGVQIWCDVAPSVEAWIVDIHRNGTTVFTTQSNRPQVATSSRFDASGAPEVTTINVGDQFQAIVDQLGDDLGGMFFRLIWTETI